MFLSIMFLFYSSKRWATLAVLVVGEEAEVEEEVVAEGDHL